MIELLNMDCMSYMKGCEDNAFDLVITSPPYNLANKTFCKNGKWKNAKIADGYNSHDDFMDYSKYKEWQQDILLEVWRILSDDGAIFYNHKQLMRDKILLNPLDLIPGLPVRQIIIWARAGGLNFSPSHYMSTHEWIIIIAKKEFNLKSQAASGVGDVWKIPQEIKNDHPAPFPLQIPMQILETTDKKRVFDPFLGSGTTAIACHKYGVDFVGTEIDKDYFDAAKKRFEAETAQLDIFA